MGDRIYRPKQKRGAAERVAGGESSTAVAGDLGASVELVEKWHRAYTRAGKAALRYTGDGEERPTLEDVRRAAQRSFPTRLLHGCHSAACFFSARYFGRNDVAHVYNAGIPEVVLNDLDRPRLDHMGTIYPPDWTIDCRDAFEAAQAYGDAGRRFDLVICDGPDADHASLAAWDHFQTFRAIARRRLFFVYTAAMFEQLGVAPDPAAASSALSNRLGETIMVRAIVKRSSFDDGVYWCVIDVGV